jgi:hypothetical protein
MAARSGSSRDDDNVWSPTEASLSPRRVVLDAAGPLREEWICPAESNPSTPQSGEVLSTPTTKSPWTSVRTSVLNFCS